jgi:hypothetical protein
MRRGVGPAALAGTVLAVAVAAPGVALAAAPKATAPARPAQTPTQVINAQTDPDAAAQALNAGCADISNCTLADATITNDYGPPAILGDALYNCAPVGSPDAYTATSISDTRAETTSLSEKLSVKLQGGLVGLVSASTEFSVFSSQSSTFSTTVTTGTQIPVPPGYEGFTTTQVLSANVTASYYITRGINLIKVTGIDMSFPGYQDKQNTGDSTVIYNTITKPINPVIILNYQTIAPCNAVSDAPSTNGLGGARPRPQKGSFKLTVCPGGGRCVTHTIPGAPPARLARATAILTRGGRAYATGTDINGRIRLTGHRRIGAGRYTLTLRKATKSHRRSQTIQTTIVPVLIR